MNIKTVYYKTNVHSIGKHDWLNNIKFDTKANTGRSECWLFAFKKQNKKNIFDRGSYELTRTAQHSNNRRGGRV